jgi:hypothetical protein
MGMVVGIVTLFKNGLLLRRIDHIADMTDEDKKGRAHESGEITAGSSP